MLERSWKWSPCLEFWILYQGFGGQVDVFFFWHLLAEIFGAISLCSFWKGRLKENHLSAVTGRRVDGTYKNCDLGDGLLFCLPTLVDFHIINHYFLGGYTLHVWMLQPRPASATPLAKRVMKTWVAFWYLASRSQKYLSLAGALSQCLSLSPYVYVHMYIYIYINMYVYLFI